MTMTLFSPLHAPPGRLDTAVQHFYDKLLHIQERLKTEPGKAMGAKRHQLVGDTAYSTRLADKFEKMVEFLNAVQDEYNAEAPKLA